MRAGDSPEAIAAEMGWPLDRVERYAGPPLAERVNIAALAAAVELRRTGEPVVLAQSIEQVLGSDDDVEWDARRRPEDGRWVVVVSVKGKPVAAWTYDLAGRSVHPLDEEARRLMGVAPARESARETAVIARPSHPSQRGEQQREHERPERPHLVSVPAPEPEPVDEPEPVVEPELAEVVDFAEHEHSHAHTGGRAEPSDDAFDELDDIPADDDVQDTGFEQETFAGQDPLADLPPAAGQQETLNLPRPTHQAKPHEPVKPAPDAPAASKPAKPARKSKAKRASVPTWDEILFGAKTPDD